MSSPELESRPSPENDIEDPNGQTVPGQDVSSDDHPENGVNEDRILAKDVTVNNGTENEQILLNALQGDAHMSLVDPIIDGTEESALPVIHTDGIMSLGDHDMSNTEPRTYSPDHVNDNAIDKEHPIWEDHMHVDRTEAPKEHNIEPYEDSSTLFVREDSPSVAPNLEHPLKRSVDPPQPVANTRVMTYDARMMNGPSDLPYRTPVGGAKPNEQNAWSWTPGETSVPEVVSGESVPKPPRKNHPTASTLDKLRKLQRMQKAQKQKLNITVSGNGVHRAQPGAIIDKDMVDSVELEQALALAEFEKEKEKYSEFKRKNGGKLRWAEEIEWMRIQGVEDARRQKVRQDALRELEEATERGSSNPTMFLDNNAEDDCGEGSAGDSSALPHNEMIDDIHEDGPMSVNFPSTRKRPRVELPRKHSKPQNLRDALTKSMRVALESQEDMPQKKRARTERPQIGAKGKEKITKAKVSKTKGTKGSKAKDPGRARQKASKKTRTPKRKGPTMMDPASLFTSDVFRDQAGDENAIDQPTFAAARKDHALKELIASVPLEHQKAAKTDGAALLAATKDFTGRGSVKAANGLWLVKGMKTALKPYQLLGSAFMRRRETAEEAPRGGLVADQMGLGKTLMMLANIVNGRPPKGEPIRATLLVASPVLLTQWQREINDHTDANLSIMRYSAGSRIDSNMNVEILQRHDVILTTYNEVMRSYPKPDFPPELQTLEEKQEWWEKVFEERGVLHRMMFHRIVLDEAQVIKNHAARTSIACRGLMANHKWALSGTPVLNTLAELYPYFKYIGVPYTGSFKVFKNNYCGSSPEATERLLLRLNQFMIRRTHKDIMFGAPILRLPKATPVTHYCDFNDVERSIYNIVRTRFIKKINAIASKGELEKSYSSVLVLLLRLRQMTAHILMLQIVMKDLLEQEDIMKIKEIAERESATPDARGRTIIAIRKQLADAAQKESNRSDTDARAQSPAMDDSADTDNPISGPSADDIGPVLPDHDKVIEYHHQGRMGAGQEFGRTYNFGQYIDTIASGESWKEIKKKTKCGKCDRVPPTQPWITSCHHIYCRRCLEELSIMAAENDRGGASCVLCSATFLHSHACEAAEEDDEEGSQHSGSSLEARRRKQKQRQKEKKRLDREDPELDWIDLEGSVLPSAKTLAIKAQIMNWIQENPDVKVIIYTQFLSMIRILARVCEGEGWQHLQYHGKMSFSARDRTIDEFAKEDNKRILLASLRCGGLGLNLTMASRVIIIDPWWNHAAEQQAFCRVFRIGQEQTTFMTRLCVKNTIDQELVEMQERKQREIDSVMEDDGKQFKQKLSIRDLLRLFGPIGETEDGQPFILVEDPPANRQGRFAAMQDNENFRDEP